MPGGVRQCERRPVRTDADYHLLLGRAGFRQPVVDRPRLSDEQVSAGARNSTTIRLVSTVAPPEGKGRSFPPMGGRPKIM